MPAFLRKFDLFFSDFKWYRRWYGGRWNFWVHLYFSDVWMPEGKYPVEKGNLWLDCYYVIEVEEY